jgi:hypothetical protein
VLAVSRLLSKTRETLSARAVEGRLPMKAVATSIAALAVLISTVTAALAAVAPADTTPPLLHIPSSIVVAATGPAGTVVFYGVSATDAVDGVVPVYCAPQAGSLFPIGDSIVACMARDSAGNAAVGGFNVHVKGAAEQIGDLMAIVSAIGPSAVGLNHILSRALVAVKAGQTSHACSELTTFGQAVYDLARRAQLTPAQASRLIDTAKRIKAVLACA